MIVVSTEYGFKKMIYFLFSEPVMPYTDIAVLFGAPGKQSASTFAAQKAFIQSLIQKYELSSTASLFGFVSFGATLKIERKFGEVEKENFRSILNNLQNRARSQTIDILELLRFIKNKVFIAKNGARKDSAKQIIIFVDKRSSNSKKELRNAIGEMKNIGIKVLVFGLGNEIDRSEIKILGSAGKWFVCTSDDIGNLINDLFKATLPGK